MNIGSTRKKNHQGTSVREFLDEVEMRRPLYLWAALFYGDRFQNQNGKSQLDTCSHPSFLTSDAMWTAAFMMLLPSSLLHDQLLVLELEAKCKWYFCHETPKKHLTRRTSHIIQLQLLSWVKPVGKSIFFKSLNVISHLLFGLFPILEYIERGSKHGVDVRAGAFWDQMSNNIWYMKSPQSGLSLFATIPTLCHGVFPQIKVFKIKTLTPDLLSLIDNKPVREETITAHTFCYLQSKDFFLCVYYIVSGECASVYVFLYTCVFTCVCTHVEAQV